VSEPFEIRKILNFGKRSKWLWILFALYDSEGEERGSGCRNQLKLDRVANTHSSQHAGFHGQRACGPGQSGRRDARRHVCYSGSRTPAAFPGAHKFSETQVLPFRLSAFSLIGAASGRNVAWLNFALFRIFDCFPASDAT